MVHWGLLRQNKQINRYKIIHKHLRISRGINELHEDGCVLARHAAENNKVN